MPDENFKPAKQTLAELQRDMSERMKIDKASADDFNLNDFVPKYFEMDPELHDLLPNGRRLQNGMKVLCEDEGSRVSLSTLVKNPKDFNLHEARKWNRWATVTDLEIVENALITGMITFVGLFEDGTKRQFIKGVEAAWYVKLDSIPEEDPLAEEEAELKEALASLVETSKIAWSGILDMLKTGVKEEADLLDAAAEKLHASTKNLKFSEKPEDLGEKKYTIQPKTVEAMVWAFVGNNADFLLSKEIHSLNELHLLYTRYCDKVVGVQWKLMRRDFLGQIKTYFQTWADVEERDEEGLFVTDTQLILFNPKPVDVEAGYSEMTNNKKED